MKLGIHEWWRWSAEDRPLVHADAEAPPLRALTLTQPWPWIIRYLGKRLENRTRNIGWPARVLRSNEPNPVLHPWVAVHSGSHMTMDEWMSAYDFVKGHFGLDVARAIPNRKRWDKPNSALPLGRLLGLVKVENLRRPTELRRMVWGADDEYRWQGRERDEPWYMKGCWAYELGAKTLWLANEGVAGQSVAELRRPEAKGSLGFWRLSPEQREFMTNALYVPFDPP